MRPNESITWFRNISARDSFISCWPRMHNILLVLYRKQKWLVHLSSLWVFESFVLLSRGYINELVIPNLSYKHVYSYVMRFGSQILAFYFSQCIHLWISVMMVNIRGGTVHRCHGSVVTVRYDFSTWKKKKSTMLGFFSFILNRQYCKFKKNPSRCENTTYYYMLYI